jgi:hypothetical protein
MHDARYPSKVASGFQMKIADLRVPSFSRLACGFGFASALSCAVLPLENPRLAREGILVAYVKCQETVVLL